MRTFRLPGFATFNNIVPYERADDNKPEPRKAKKKKTKKQLKTEEEDPSLIEPEEPERPVIPVDEVGMGGPEGRVYWPPGMEEWLRPKKREVKKKEEESDEHAMAHPTPMNLDRRKAIKARQAVDGDIMAQTPSKAPAKKTLGKRTPAKKAVSPADTEASLEDEEETEAAMPSLSDEELRTPPPSTPAAARQSGRKTAAKSKSYAEDPGSE